MTLSVETQLATVTCCECSLVFAVPAQFSRLRHEDHGWFYCPRGHPLHYPGESLTAKLRRERDQLTEQVATLNRQLIHERARANGLKGQATRRAKTGDCHP